MKVAIVGTDLSALLCAWYLRNVADVTIINPQRSIAGFCPNYRWRNDTTVVNLDHLLFAFDRAQSHNTNRLLNSLGVEPDEYAVNCKFSLDGNLQSAAYVSATSQHPFLFSDDKPNWRNIFSSQPFVDLTLDLVSTQVGVAQTLLNTYFLTPKTATAGSVSYSPMRNLSLSNYQPTSLSDKRFAYVPSSLELSNRLLQRSKSTMLLSQNITHIDISSDNRPHCIYLANNGVLDADHIIFSSIPHGVTLDERLAPALTHFQSIQLREHTSILHTWPGVLTHTQQPSSQVQYHYWHTSLGVSYLLKRLPTVAQPLFLSHNVAFDIPSSAIIDQQTMLLPSYNKNTYATQKLLQPLQGQGDIWFTGNRCYDTDIESLVTQALQICQRLGAACHSSAHQ